MIRFLRLPPSDVTIVEGAPRWSVEALVRQELGPALYYRLRERGCMSSLSEEEQHSLRHAFDCNAIRNLVLETHLHYIVRAFNRRGIPVMLLKGAVGFFEPLYPSAAIRVMGDLDVLVPTSQLETAEPEETVLMQRVVEETVVELILLTG